jgi:molecular chaperone DnaK (HSP70)
MNSTFLYINRLLAMRYKSEFTEKEKAYCLTNIEFSQDNNFSENISFNFDYEGMNLSLPGEAIFGAYLDKLKNDLLIFNKIDIFCITLAVPDFFTLAEKEALGRAFKICDIDNYNIINESTASNL